MESPTWSLNSHNCSENYPKTKQNRAELSIHAYWHKHCAPPITRGGHVISDSTQNRSHLSTLLRYQCPVFNCWTLFTVYIKRMMKWIPLQCPPDDNIPTKSVGEQSQKQHPPKNIAAKQPDLPFKYTLSLSISSYPSHTVDDSGSCAKYMSASFIQYVYRN